MHQYCTNDIAVYIIIIVPYEIYRYAKWVKLCLCNFKGHLKFLQLNFGLLCRYSGTDLKKKEKETSEKLKRCNREVTHFS